MHSGKCVAAKTGQPGLLLGQAGLLVQPLRQPAGQAALAAQPPAAGPARWQLVKDKDSHVSFTQMCISVDIT